MSGLPFFFSLLWGVMERLLGKIAAGQQDELEEALKHMGTPSWGQTCSITWLRSENGVQKS